MCYLPSVLERRKEKEEDVAGRNREEEEVKVDRKGSLKRWKDRKGGKDCST